MSYRPHDALADAARPMSGFGRLAIGVFLLVAGFYFGLILMQNAIASIMLPSSRVVFASELQRGDTARSMLFVLVSLGCAIPALGVALRLAHRRGLDSLIGPMPVVLSDFWRVARVLSVLYAILVILPMPSDFAPLQNMRPGTWLLLLPISLIAVLIQITAEELVFRGYFQSQLAARFRHPVIWLGLPAALFGVLHYDPGNYGANAMLVAVWAAGFGLAAADLTARTGSLGAALAFHFANNVFALVVISTHGSFSGLSLLTYPFGPGDAEAIRAFLPVDALTVFVGWLAARLALRR